MLRDTGNEIGGGGMNDMFACPACGFMNYPGQKFCGQCGEILKYYCPNCDTVIDQTHSECPGCGALFNWPASRQIEEPDTGEETIHAGVIELSETEVDVARREEEILETEPGEPEAQLEEPEIKLEEPEIRPEEPEVQPDEPAKDLEEKTKSKTSGVSVFGAYIGGLFKRTKSKPSDSEPIKDEEQEAKPPEVEEVVEEQISEIVAEVETQKEKEEPVRIEDFKIDETQVETRRDDIEPGPDSDVVVQIVDEPEEIKQDVVEVQEEKEVVVEEEEAEMQAQEATGTQDGESTYRQQVASQAEGTTCYYHHGRDARYMCPKCGQPVCKECYGIRHGEIQCWHCYSK